MLDTFDISKLLQKEKGYDILIDTRNLYLEDIIYGTRK